ncbi:iron-sulfur cluster assembly accessory protein [Buchnera aphidicola (Kurisakia onigurumii)]|uniref:HesB/IscA family protein n=1 Tax=Buchnera aphidicola TaxID=9 RepID=UPI0031B6D834
MKKEMKKKLKGITISKKAYNQICYLNTKIKNHEKILLNIKKSGCAGFKYSIEFFENKKKLKTIKFNINKIQIYILKKNINFLDGIEIDFKNTNLSKNFTFNNPNVKNVCGCGESFSVK